MDTTIKFNPYGDVSKILEILRLNKAKQTSKASNSGVALKYSVAPDTRISNSDTLAKNSGGDMLDRRLRLEQNNGRELSNIGEVNSLHKIYSSPSSENKSKLILREKLQMEAKLASKNQRDISFKLRTMTERQIKEMKNSKEMKSESTAAPNPVGKTVKQWKKCYKRHSFLDIESNENVELRPTTHIEGISQSTIGKVLCSLLNTGKHSVIYFGVDENGLVDGVVIAKQERDSFRVKLDAMIVELIHPMLMPSGYEVIFNPVLQFHDTVREIYSTHSRFVIEIHLHPIHGVLYTLSDATCYMRKGDLTYLASMHDVRKWIAKHEEEKYIKELEFLELICNRMSRRN